MNGLNFKVNVLVNIPLPFGRFWDLGFISSTIGGLAAIGWVMALTVLC